MKREAFRDRFQDALSSANSFASDKSKASVDQIELHLYGVNDRNFEEALTDLWISEVRFFLVIDVAVHPKRDGWFFVRPSGHEPAELTQTINHSASAPFHVMAPA
jgi:hypothetical protein